MTTAAQRKQSKEKANDLHIESCIKTFQKRPLGQHTTNQLLSGVLRCNVLNPDGTPAHQPSVAWYANRLQEKLNRKFP